MTVAGFDIAWLRFRVGRKHDGLPVGYPPALGKRRASAGVTEGKPGLDYSSAGGAPSGRGRLETPAARRSAARAALLFFFFFFFLRGGRRHLGGYAGGLGLGYRPGGGRWGFFFGGSRGLFAGHGRDSDGTGGKAARGGVLPVFRPAHRARPFGRGTGGKLVTRLLIRKHRDADRRSPLKEWSGPRSETWVVVRASYTSSKGFHWTKNYGTRTNPYRLIISRSTG